MQKKRSLWILLYWCNFYGWNDWLYLLYTPKWLFWAPARTCNQHKFNVKGILMKQKIIFIIEYSPCKYMLAWFKHSWLDLFCISLKFNPTQTSVWISLNHRACFNLPCAKCLLFIKGNNLISWHFEQYKTMALTMWWW